LDDGARARDLGVDDDDARTSRARDAETAVDDDDAARGGGSANERCGVRARRRAGRKPRGERGARGGPGSFLGR
jgi:hypothetical protein